MKYFFHLFFVGWLLCFALIFGNQAYGQEQKKILVLFSYDANFHIYQQSVVALNHVFQGPEYEIDVDFLNSKRYPIGALNQNLRDRIAIKSRENGGYDLIIAGNDPAFRLCVDLQEELFPQTPIVFWGVNDQELAFAQDQNPWITGVAENISSDRLFSVINQIHHGPKKMVLLVDNTISGQADLKVCLESLKSFSEIQYEVVQIEKFSKQEFGQFLQTIPSDHILLIVAAYRLSDSFIDMSEIGQLIRSYIGNIVYVADATIENEIFVGGVEKGYLGMMNTACLIGKQILKGADVASLKVIKELAGKVKINYQVASLFQADLSELPDYVRLHNLPSERVEIKKETFYIVVISGSIFFLVLIFITFYFAARRKLEKTLRVNAENYHVIFKENHSSMLVIDPENGQIVDANEAAVKFYGYASDEFRFMCLKDIDMMPEYDLLIVLRRSGQGASCLHAHHRLKNGQVKDVEIYAGRIPYDEKVYIYLIIHDVSERVIAEKELLEAKEKAEESDRLKSAFLANMSHEIRTPMNSILGFSSLLEMEECDADTRKDYLRYIQKSGEHLLSLINDIIDISKIEANQMSIRLSPCHVNRLMEDVYGMARSQVQLYKKEGLSLRMVNDSSVPDLILVTDEVRLKQILINLINNAIKFTEEGEVVFGYRLREDGVVQFFVKDTGIGIPEDKHTIIFSVFRQVEQNNTRNYGGAGLGLSITQSLVEKLGGRIWVMSEPGKGSRFYFTHPYSCKRIDLAENTQAESGNKESHLFRN